MSSVTNVSATGSLQNVWQANRSAQAVPAGPTDNSAVSSAPSSSSAGYAPPVSLSSQTQSLLIQLQGAQPGSSSGQTGSSAEPASISQFAANLNPATEAAAESQFLQNFAKASFNSADSNHDGSVSKNEYVQMMTSPVHPHPLTPQQALQAWDQLDPQNANSLTEAQYEAQTVQMFKPPVLVV